MNISMSPSPVYWDDSNGVLISNTTHASIKNTKTPLFLSHISLETNEQFVRMLCKRV